MTSEARKSGGEATKAPAQWMQEAAEETYNLLNEWLAKLLRAEVPELRAEELRPRFAQIILEHSEAASERLETAIREAIAIIPGSMGGHVTLGLNILQAALRPTPENRTVSSGYLRYLDMMAAASPQGTPELCPSCNSPLIFAVGCANAWHSLAEKRLVNSPAKCSTFREWLIDGGGGHEDGEAGIRACTLPLSLAIEMVEEYLEYRAGTQVEALPDKCAFCHDEYDRELAEKVYLSPDATRWCSARCAAGIADHRISQEVALERLRHSTVAAQPCQQARKTPESSSRTGGIAPTHVEQAGSNSAAQPDPFSKGYKHRDGKPVSDACGDGKHAECTQDLSKCHCTARSGHTVMHAYINPQIVAAQKEKDNA